MDRGADGKSGRRLLVPGGRGARTKSISKTPPGGTSNRGGVLTSDAERSRRSSERKAMVAPPPAFRRPDPPLWDPKLTMKNKNPAQGTQGAGPRRAA
jgi:hypothetical protein